MFFDLNENPLSGGSVEIVSAAVKQFSMKIECLAGYKLTCPPTSDLTVEARALGESGWTNIETTPLVLTPYAGTRQTFELRLTAASLADVSIKNISLKVNP